MALIDRRIILRATLAAVLISATALSACGRKGALELPPSAKATTTDGADASTTSGDTETDKEKAKPSKPKRPFLLDPLI